MKRTAVCIVLVTAALAVPGYAAAKGKPGGDDAPRGQSRQAHGKSHKCKSRSVAYVLGGTLVASDLTLTTGQDTPADQSDDRYGGTVTLAVTHANHWAKALSGQQTVSLTNVRVSFADGVAQPPPAGTRVQLIGKVTAVAKKCSDTNTAGVVTFTKATFLEPSATGSDQT
jgi:hypothetical protein